LGKIRFRREKASIIPSQTLKPKLIGRPKKEEGEAVNRKIRVSGKLLNMIFDYRDENSTETYNDTILRIVAKKTQIIIEQSERIKELERENQQLKEKHGFNL